MSKVKLSAVLILLTFATVIPTAMAKKEGTSIQDGVLLYSAGHWLEDDPLIVGYDIFGYNYHSHMFSGYYCNAYLGGAGLPPYTGDISEYPSAYLDEFEDHWTYEYKDVWLIMKWNDAWLSNMDRDDDGSLDRHWGHTNYDGSGAWLTNHQAGTYEVDSTVYHWTYYVMIITPSTANGDYKASGNWYNVDDEEIGPVIWGAFAITLSVYNDLGTGEHGVEYLSSVAPGFGYYSD